MSAAGSGHPVVTLVDLLRIQRYVFASNRLRDVIDGSALVEEAASEDRINELAPAAEVVFAAGGMAALRFHGDRDNLAAARKFAAGYSRWLVDKAPGLEVEIVHRPARIGQWRRAVLDGLEQLEEAKRGRAGHAPMLGLSVTAECAETRLVAGWRERREGRWRPLAPTVAVRRERGVARRKAGLGTQWDWLLKDLPPNPDVTGVTPSFPEEMDHLSGRTDERSLIGIVHVDGNGVGARLRRWLGALDGSLPDDRVVQSQRDLSRHIGQVFRSALKAAVDRAWMSVKPGQEGFEVVSRVLDRGFGLRVESGGELWLPVRPVLVGGDDLTFVCDGRIALDLARCALEKIHGAPIAQLGGALGACAGVAIARAHTPVVPTHGLAEALCGSAKAMLLAEGRGEPAYAADWHVGRHRPLETLADLRDRQYAVPGGPSAAAPRRLTLRPYELGRPDEPHTLAWLDETVLGDATGSGFLGSDWQGHRNKIKALAEIVREDPDEVNQALADWEVTAGSPRGLPGGLPADGFVATRGVHATPLLDAVELLDIHYPLR